MSGIEEDLRTELAEANHRLGAVAALADEHRRTVDPAPYTTERALIERLTNLLGPVSGAVEGAGVRHSPSCGVLRCRACDIEEDDPTPVAGHEQEVRAELEAHVAVATVAHPGAICACGHPLGDDSSTVALTAAHLDHLATVIAGANS